MQRQHISWPLQLSFLGLFGISVVAALWQKGQPLATIVILAAVLPAGLIARLPRRWAPPWTRQILQGAIIAAGGAWFYVRLGQVPLDLALVEATAVFGVALAVLGNRGEYGMLATISFILVGYGGLSAGRTVYLPAFMLYAVFALLLLYQTRAARLVGRRELVAGTPPQRLANWGYRGLHFLLSAGLFGLLVAICPFPRGRSAGVIPASLETPQPLEFPLLWRDWLSSAHSMLSPRTGRQTTDEDGDDAALTRDGAKLIELDKQGRTLDARRGAGGGVGDDLVFRVQAPGRLYWLAQLYDVYDGDSWKASERLRHGGWPLDGPQLAGRQRVMQRFSIEKPVSRRLYGAYRAYQYILHFPDADPATARADAPPPGKTAWCRDLRGAAAPDPAPPLPWRYECCSFFPAMGANQTPERRARLRRLVAKSHYLDLPRHVVSERLRKLATDLTADCGGPMAKALALRDHLRSSYKYNVETPAIPESAEPVDYFLFESKEGYCHHFAQALAVLARLAGLPARVAAGYSPGHYNVLTDCFEVYEYHAHAWTQIFVQPYGWLTVDGVAPGVLRLESRPAVMGHVLSPFGEEWQARPPELALRAPAAPASSSAAAKATTAQPTRLAVAVGKVYRSAITKSGQAKPPVKALLAATAAEIKRQAKSLYARMKAAVVKWFARLKARLVKLGRSLAAFLRGLSRWVHATLLAACAAILAVVRNRRALRRFYAHWRSRRRCTELWNRLRGARDREPGLVIGMCYEVTQELLALARYRRPVNLDLMEFVDCVATVEPDLASDLSVVFSAFSRQLFGRTQPSPEEARTAFESAAKVRDALLGADIRRAGA